MSDLLAHPSLQFLRTQWGRIYSAWLQARTNLTTEPSAFGVPNVTIKDVDETLTTANVFLSSTDSQINFNPIFGTMYVKNGHWQNSANAVCNSIANVQANPANWPALFDQIHNFLSAVSQSFWGGPNLTLNAKLNSSIKQKISQADEAFRKAEQLLQMAESARDKNESLTASILTSNQNADQVRIKLNEGLESLAAYKKGLNQKGLAQAFTDRADGLWWPLTRWVLLFVASIAIISSVTLIPYLITVYRTKAPTPASSIGPITQDQSSMDDRRHDPKELAFEMFIRILISSPIIWLAWFSAKQYATTKRLKEEYEFKAASAVAYYGYSQEASSDEELMKQLLQGAIRNFNENPAGAVDMSKAKVSPIEEAFLELIKKADPSFIQKLLDSIVALRKA